MILCVSYLLDWDRFFRGNLRTWQLTNLDWIRSFKGPLHIVMYNQLRDNLGPTLRSLVQFLDLPLDEAAIQCTIEHSEGLYHRRSCSDGFDPFTDSMKKQIADVESSVFKELGQYATWRKIWKWNWNIGKTVSSKRWLRLTETERRVILLL